MADPNASGNRTKTKVGRDSRLQQAVEILSQRQYQAAIRASRGCRTRPEADCKGKRDSGILTSSIPGGQHRASLARTRPCRLKTSESYETGSDLNRRRCLL